MNHHLDLCKQFINTLLSVNVSFLHSTSSDIEDFIDSCYPEILEVLTSKASFKKYLLGLESKRIYQLTDRFLINYLILRFDEGQTFMILGPYLTEQATTSFCEKVLNTNDLPISRLLPLSLYYNTLPVCQNSSLISSIQITLQQIYGPETELDYTHHTLFDKEKSEELLCIPEENQEFTMKLLEERYAAENKILLEIQNGNTQGALAAQREFSNMVKGVTRSEDPIRNAKNLNYISNTIFRKAAERAAVHPVYIDILSSHIAYLIENTNSVERLLDLRGQMVKDYCNLVKKHTLKNYSPLIRKTINYIHINLSTELHLKDIAHAIDVSPNYLSNLFNKETKQSLTSFIHQKRIDKAAELLKTSDLSIQTIAFYVGYSDMNYFTKLFKKQMGVTPTGFKTQKRLI